MSISFLLGVKGSKNPYKQVKITKWDKKCHQEALKKAGVKETK